MDPERRYTHITVHTLLDIHNTCYTLLFTHYYKREDMNEVKIIFKNLMNEFSRIMLKELATVWKPLKLQGFFLCHRQTNRNHLYHEQG